MNNSTKIGTIFSTNHMYSISIQEIKKRGSNALSKTGPTYIIVNSEIDFVALPKEQYEAIMEELETADDIRVAKEREGEPTIPFEQFVKEVEDELQDNNS